MIQSYLKEKLADQLPQLTWTVDYRTKNDHTGTVYYEGGGQPGQYDVKVRYPRYMVYISSSDWEFAEYAAQAAFDAIHRTAYEDVQVDFYKDEQVIDTKNYYINFIAAASEPNPIGVENGIMDYSINFEVILVEHEKEEINHGT